MVIAMESWFGEMLADAASVIYRPLPFVFWPLLIGALFWIVFMWLGAGSGDLFAREIGRQRRDGFRQGIVAAYQLRLETGSALRLRGGSRHAALGDGLGRYALYGGGLILMISGALLRQHCFRMLGEHFTYKVRVSERAEIVKRGIIDGFATPLIPEA